MSRKNAQRKKILQITSDALLGRTIKFVLRKIYCSCDLIITNAWLLNAEATLQYMQKYSSRQDFRRLYHPNKTTTLHHCQNQCFSTFFQSKIDYEAMILLHPNKHSAVFNAFVQTKIFK